MGCRARIYGETLVLITDGGGIVLGSFPVGVEGRILLVPDMGMRGWQHATVAARVAPGSLELASASCGLMGAFCKQCADEHFYMAATTKEPSRKPHCL